MLAAVALLIHLVSVGAGQLVVHHLLDAVDAVALIVHTAQQRAQLGARGVDAIAAQLAPHHAGQMQVVDLALELGGDVPLDHLIAVDAIELGAEFHGVHTVQHRGQQTRHSGRAGGADGLVVDLVAIPQRLGLVRPAGHRFEQRGRVGVGEQRVALHALGEHVAVGVQDPPALGADRHRGGAALGGRLRGGTTVQQLDADQPPEACHGHERQNDTDGHAPLGEPAIPAGPHLSASHCVPPSLG